VPVIEVTVRVEAPLEVVYEAAHEVERLPEFDENLQSVTVVEREGSRTVSEWVGLVREFRQTIRWTEEDVWDDAQRVCRFRQLKGDFDRYEGEWTFTAEEGGTRFALRLEYEYNVPLIGPLIKNLLHKKTVQSCEGVMNAIKAMAEARGG
jgi:ribosome-associated toxin RatA of RatAB toxin-antitoxin module